MIPAHAWSRCPVHPVGAWKRSRLEGRIRFGWLGLSCALIILLAGCQANWTAGSGMWGTRPDAAPVAVSDRQAAVPASAPATQAQGPADPDDPTTRLTAEIEQYVSNLPVDDLQAKLSRHETTMPQQSQPRESEPSAAEPSPAPQLLPPPAPAPAARQVSPTAAAHVPLQPEVIVQPAVADQPTSGQPVGSPPQTPKVEPQAGTPAMQVGTQVIEVDIAPNVLAALPARPKEPAANRTNQPAAVKPQGTSELADLIDQLRKQAADRPDSVGAALRARLAEWSLAGAHSPADWPLQDLEKRRLADAVWNVLQAVGQMETTPQGPAVQQFGQAIQTLSDTLQQVQPLQIPSVALCRSVSSFANYDALPEPWDFPVGRTSMVVLYCELAGFRSEPVASKEGWYHTLLSQRFSILTDAGKELWNYEDQQVEDVSRRPRRDFFIARLLKIPAELPAGSYVLKVTIRDRLANRVTETNIPFAISPAALTAK